MRRVSRWSAVLVLGALVLAAAALVASPSLPEHDLANLAANDPQARQAAVQGLAASGQFSDLLYELGRDHTPLVKTGLAEAMATMGVRTSDLDAVRGLLSNRDPVVRRLGVGLLSGHAPAVWRDLERVADDEAEVSLVRAAAAAALGSAGAEARSALLDLVRDVEAPGVLRGAALRALALVSPAGADDVRSVAEDASRDWADRTVAVQALAQPTSPSDTALTLLAGSRVPRLRSETAAAMARRGKPQHLTTLVALVGDTWPNVRHEALQALWVLGGAQANRTTVVGRLLDADPRVKALAAKLVGQTCADIASTVKPSLVPLLANTNFRVRHEAALALFALGDKSGAATMLADGASTNPSQRQMATQAYSLITAKK